ncbi:MAG TPA: DUF962 domain-containing protein [Acidimicrobiales bacterium]|jgi:hypothetical protein
MTTITRITDPNEATSFEEFWPYYLSQHMEAGTRKAHVVGTLVATLVFVRGLATRRLRRMLAAPLVGYAFAWTSHLAIEGNKPATVGNPLWSFQGDFRLVYRTLNGTIDADVSAVRSLLTEESRTNGSSTAPSSVPVTPVPA